MLTGEHEKPDNGHDRSRVLERHVQTLILGLATVGIMWMAKNQVDNGNTLAAMQVQLTTLSVQLSTLNSNAETRAEHQMDVNYLGKRIDGTEKRVDRLETAKQR